MNDSPLNPDIVEDIKRVAAKRDVLSLSEYLQEGHFTKDQIYDDGHTFEEYCTAAGVSTKKKKRVRDEEYYERLKHATETLGRLPKTSERKRFGLKFDSSRFPGGFKAFIKKAIELGYIEPPLKPIPDEAGGDEQLSAPVLNNIADGSQNIPLRVNRARPIPPIPAQTKHKKWERTGIDGFPYAPHHEDGVIAIFAVLCSQGAIKWQILDLNRGKGIDAICYDEVTDKEIRVEIKLTLSRASWNHKIEDVDYVVCWESKWPDFPKPVIVLRELLKANQQ